MCSQAGTKTDDHGAPRPIRIAMVKGLARLKAACTMTGWPSMLTQASSEEERLLPND